LLNVGLLTLGKCTKLLCLGNRLDCLLCEIQPSSVSELLWFVAHTRPRCEKKVVEFCERERIASTLPCYKTAHKYRGKTVVFRKPLFPGYVFLQLFNEQRRMVYQSDYVANLLEVLDQSLFAQQLGEILRALDTDLEILLAPAIGKGMRVLIK